MANLDTTNAATDQSSSKSQYFGFSNGPISTNTRSNFFHALPDNASARSTAQSFWQNERERCVNDQQVFDAELMSQYRKNFRTENRSYALATEMSFDPEIRDVLSARARVANRPLVPSPLVQAWTPETMLRGELLIQEMQLKGFDEKLWEEWQKIFLEEVVMIKGAAAPGKGLGLWSDQATDGEEDKDKQDSDGNPDAPNPGSTSFEPPQN